MFLTFSSRKLIQIPTFCKLSSVSTSFSTNSDISLSDNDQISGEIHNRNPRNLERLRIGWRPQGYHLETKGRSFWHKLELRQSQRYLSAEVVHHTGFIAVSASTTEWCIRKHLYRDTDLTAYVNVARVLARRCLETGLTEISFGVDQPSTKMAKFAEIMEQEGISLREPDRFLPARPWDHKRPEKPWEDTS